MNPNQIQKLMQQAQAMQKKMTDAQAELEKQEIEGTSGGGMVKVVMTGKFLLRRVTIDKSIITVDDKEMLEDLIVAAVNDAHAKVEAESSSQMSALTAGLPLPPGFKL
jgi:nucleoid-associated protein EbfC